VRRGSGIGVIELGEWGSWGEGRWERGTKRRVGRGKKAAKEAGEGGFLVGGGNPVRELLEARSLTGWRKVIG